MNVIEKIVSPSNAASCEEYGTIWIADLESGKEIWLQTSLDEEFPKWRRLGDLYEQIFLNSPESQDIMLSATLFGMTYRKSE